MVGRVEVLTPDREKTIERAVADLGSPSAPVRQAAQAKLAELGRFQEPGLHRVALLTRSAEVRARAQDLLKKLPAPR